MKKENYICSPRLFVKANMNSWVHFIFIFFYGVTSIEIELTMLISRAYCALLSCTFTILQETLTHFFIGYLQDHSRD